MADWRVEFIADCEKRIADGEEFISQAESGVLHLFRIENGQQIDETPALVARERAGIASLRVLMDKATADLRHGDWS